MRISLVLLLALTGVGSRADSQQTSTTMLSCQPRKLTPQHTLGLRFGAGHPAELAVRAPDGTTLFLVYDRDKSIAPELQPVVEKNVFRGLRELKLPVATASASPWVVGREKNERIFSKRGRYEFVLTDVLESDAGYRRFRCSVNFTP